MRPTTTRILPMRRVLPALAALALGLSPALARAGGDATSAAGLGALGLLAPSDRAPAYGLSAGLGGFSFARGDDKGFFYLAGQFNQLASIEVGFGVSTVRSGPFTLFAAGGILAAPVDGFAIGLRGLTGVVWHYQAGAFFFRPGLTLAPGFVASPDDGLHVVMPLEGALELGFDVGALRPFVRVAAGIDPAASPFFWTAHANASVGVSWTFDPPPAKPATAETPAK